MKFVIFKMEFFLIMQIAINSAIERLECFQECIGLISCRSSLTNAEIWLNLWTEALSRIFAMSDGFTHNKLGGTIAVIADRK